MSPDDDPDALADEDEQRVERALTVLGEHFEAVRIFVSRPSHHDPEATSGLSRGRGNYYAQRGMVEDWLIQERARTRHDATGGE